MENVDLIYKLNRAYADEWLAHVQYLTGALVAVGDGREPALAEFRQHAEDEHRHALLLADRILALGGTPLLAPAEWPLYQQCGYLPPTETDVARITAQNITSESCAIRVYTALLAEVKLTDPETATLIQSILGDEIEHEEDLQGVLAGLASEDVD